jgi:GTP diphosphokinase / guanosine-3',5'-bis(diphosphate) 3'-diphosphatase
MMNEKKALEIAEIAHAGVVRKGSDEPYVNHPIRVAAAMPFAPEDYRIVALLHDVIEDGGVKPADLLAAGLHVHLVIDLEMLSRPKHMSYADYIMVLGRDGSHRAIVVKMADLADNMRDLAPDASLMKRYLKAHAVLAAALAKKSSK